MRTDVLAEQRDGPGQFYRAICHFYNELSYTGVRWVLRWIGRRCKPAAA